MGKKHFTALGQQIDMAALAVRHSETVALGNARMNAKGDIVNSQGIVLRTQEQIEEEWKRNKERHDASLGISQNLKDPLPVAHAKKKLDDDQDFDPSTIDESISQESTPQPTQPARRRKIVDAD